MSLDRLINLARKTGDRLIVHQPDEGTDVVIMSVDEYENFFAESRDVRTLSERQLIDKINRDIAIWRANDKFDEAYPDKNEEDDTNNLRDDWNSTASILNNEFDYPEDGFLPAGLKIENKEARERDGVVEEEVSFLGQGGGPEAEIPSPKKEAIKEVPWMENSDIGSNWHEETLPEDEPVFYEEPV